MFQKRHYKILAQLLKETQNKIEFEEYLIAYLKWDNYRFDEARFREAMQKTPQAPK